MNVTLKLDCTVRRRRCRSSAAADEVLSPSDQLRSVVFHVILPEASLEVSDIGIFVHQLPLVGGLVGHVGRPAHGGLPIHPTEFEEAFDGTCAPIDVFDALGSGIRE